ncbi:hypothetical protein WDZ92_36135, partial [Nostoc sp. NIES-2111]
MHIRLFISAALVGAGAITTAALTPWTLGEGTAGAPLPQQLTALTGLSVKDHGAIRFTVLPLPQLVVDRVQLAAADGKLTVETDSLRATLRLLPLVTGRIELTEVALGRPVFDTRDFDEDNLVGLLSRLFDEGPETSPDLRRLKILEGEIGLVGPEGQRTVLFGKVDAVFTRARLSSDIEAAASFDWRGERVEAEASADPAAILHDGASGPLSIRLKSQRADMALNGTVAGGGQPQVNGALTLKSPDLRAAADWLGLRLPLPLAGPLDVSGTARIEPSTFDLANARIELTGGQFDGVFSAKVQDGALTIGGTTAPEQLNPTDAMGPLSPRPAADGGWAPYPLPGHALPTGDPAPRSSAAPHPNRKPPPANAPSPAHLPSG